MSIREPAVAGAFYEGTESRLIRQIEYAFTGPNGPGSIPKPAKEPMSRIVGLVCPHAGYMYSGDTAAHAYSKLAEDGIPEVVVLIGPNHHYYAPAIALADDSGWRTPLGVVEVDRDVTKQIKANLPLAEINSTVHRMEHSLEVQLPFLQYIARLAEADFRIVPVSVGAIASVSVDADAKFAGEVGSVISKAVAGKRALIIASTDFTHYKAAIVAKEHDSLAIRTILNLNEYGLLEVVALRNISMCGALPTAIMLATAKILGAKAATLLKYSNSGDVTGDYTEVVGYAAIEVSK